MIRFTKINLPINPNYESLEELQGQIQGQYDQLKRDFSKFKEVVEPLLVEVRGLFLTKTDSDPVSLTDDLETYIQYSFTLGQYIIWADEFLKLFEMLYFCPKAQKVSETDRKQYTSLKSLEQNSTLALLQKYEEKVDKKITVLQSRLKAETEKGRKFGNHEQF